MATRKPPSRRGGINRKPPVKVNKRQRLPASVLGAVGTTPDPIDKFGEKNYQYGRLPDTPQAYNVEYTRIPASLSMANNRNVLSPSTKFEFWCTAVSFGYGAKGSSSSSKFYEAFYARSNDQKPLSIEGRVPNENYFDEMVEWIRDGQIDMARGLGKMWLEIPAAKIFCWGFIPSFNGGHEAGYAPAPEINFDFVVTRDRRTGKGGEMSQSLIPYFLDPAGKTWLAQEKGYKNLLFGEDGNVINKEGISKDTLDALDNMFGW